MKHYADVNAHHFHLDKELYRLFYSNKIEISAILQKNLNFITGRNWGGGRINSTWLKTHTPPPP